MCSAAVRNSVRLTLLLCLALCALASLSCRSQPSTVKIGLVAPFEGRHRAVGYDAIYAARLAMREANERDAAHTWRVELVALDDGGDAELARQAAASLALDEAVVAVIGHWLDETTAAARPLYETEGLPLLATGAPPFQSYAAASLPPTFLEQYAAVTPFDEVAGPYAGPTYDAFRLLLSALEVAEMSGEMSRDSVAASLEGLQYQGVTGTVYRP